MGARGLCRGAELSITAFLIIIQGVMPTRHAAEKGITTTAPRSGCLLLRDAVCGMSFWELFEHGDLYPEPSNREAPGLKREQKIQSSFLPSQQTPWGATCLQAGNLYSGVFCLPSPKCQAWELAEQLMAKVLLPEDDGGRMSRILKLPG